MTAQRKDNNVWKNILFITLTIVFSIVTSLIAASYERGEIKTKVSVLEDCDKELKTKDSQLEEKISTDHDILIQVNTKLDGVKESIQEIGKKLDRFKNTSAGKRK